MMYSMFNNRKFENFKNIDYLCIYIQMLIVIVYYCLNSLMSEIMHKA